MNLKPDRHYVIEPHKNSDAFKCQNGLEFITETELGKRLSENSAFNSRVDLPELSNKEDKENE